MNVSTTFYYLFILGQNILYHSIVVKLEANENPIQTTQPI